MLPTFDDLAENPQALSVWAGAQLADDLGAERDHAAVLYSVWATSRGVLSEQARESRSQRLATDRARALLFGMPDPDLTPPSSPFELRHWLAQWAGSELDPLASVVGIADKSSALNRWLSARAEHVSQQQRARDAADSSSRRAARQRAALAARTASELEDAARIEAAYLAVAWESRDDFEPPVRTPAAPAFRPVRFAH